MTGGNSRWVHENVPRDIYRVMQWLKTFKSEPCIPYYAVCVAYIWLTEVADINIASEIGIQYAVLDKMNCYSEFELEPGSHSSLP